MRPFWLPLTLAAGIRALLVSVPRVPALWVTALLVPALLLPDDALAQSRKAPKVEDAEEEEDEELAPQKSSQANQQPVEVARGFYMKVDPGFFDFRGTIQANPNYYPFGMGDFWSVDFRYIAGYDMLTSGRMGLSLEALYGQTTTYSSPYDATTVPEFMTLGHFRTQSLEVAARPTALLGPKGRFNLYARFGLGANFIHLHRSIESIPSQQQELLQYYSSLAYGLHPHPYVVGGAGLEYYTRLSHFSFTFAEINYYYMMGFDTALSFHFAGLKYTF